MYLYKTIIYKNTSSVIGAPASSAADKTDFETNHKSSCVMVSDIVIAETSFVTNLTYAEFEAKITLPVVWADVKCLELENTYELVVASENPI